MIPGRRATVAIALLAGLLAGCGSTMSIRSDADPSVDFSSFQTFGWISDNPLVSVVSAQPISPLTERRLMDATRADLEARGFRFTENVLEADFAVAFTIGSREEVRVDTYPSTFHGSWGWAHSHRHRGFHMGTSTRVRTSTRGTLSVDVFEVATQNPVWHGQGSMTVTRSILDDPETAIASAVNQILNEFGV